jgi:3-hydroxymyristoyl/3-hydroxydecanoyl-(acyl carrier protein) dehydratase
MENQQTITFAIPACHPSLPGHFPDQPIVPGVVILNAVLTALQSVYEGKYLHKIKLLKFYRPLLPEHEVRLHWQEIATNQLRFQCRHASSNLLYLEGRLHLTAGGD